MTELRATASTSRCADWQQAVNSPHWHVGHHQDVRTLVSADEMGTRSGRPAARIRLLFRPTPAPEDSAG
ncbi:hypothetical protein T12_11239 [Trichinella patagoniensis]|uniref:Uncharacterized protein n=1 Tax=Trichinella patagoniensis TaxID=990121 RepID=A0A0V1A758_9BILA|nr:hypothetical protein T12_11239 [Trichinella patagoniensis]